MSKSNKVVVKAGFHKNICNYNCINELTIELGKQSNDIESAEIYDILCNIAKAGDLGWPLQEFEVIKGIVDGVWY